MSTDDKKDDDQGMKMVELAISPYHRQMMESDADSLRTVIAQAHKDFEPMKERLVEMAVMGESFKEVLKAMRAPCEALNAIRFPSESFLAIQKLTLPKIWDFPCTSVLKTVAEATSRHQEIIKEVAAMQMSFMSMKLPSMDSLYEPSVISVRPVREQTVINNITVTVTIQQLVVHRDGRPLVAVPEAGCIELDPYFQLCDKPKEKRFGLHYYKQGEWKFEELTALQTRLLHYLYDMGFRPHTYAQKLAAIAEALTSSKVSISNRINELEKTCERLGIQYLLAKVGEDKWCLTRQLGCFEGMWEA